MKIIINIILKNVPISIRIHKTGHGCGCVCGYGDYQYSYIQNEPSFRNYVDAD